MNEQKDTLIYYYHPEWKRVGAETTLLQDWKVLYGWRKCSREEFLAYRKQGYSDSSPFKVPD